LTLVQAGRACAAGSFGQFRSPGQRTDNHLATPPPPHGRKKLEPPWAAVCDLPG